MLSFFKAEDARTSHRRFQKYKYKGNAPVKTPSEKLAYQQPQRFWVAQAIKDAKSGLGMDEYQACKWNARHHRVTLTILARLFVLRSKVENRRDIPLLTVTDIKEILTFLLPT